MKIAVIGLGTAGQSASIFLKRLGHSVKVFERVAKPQPIGAGFLLQPTAFYPLHKLGVLPEILKHGSKITKVIGHNTKARKVLDLKYTDVDERLFALGFYRGTLFSTLLTVMEKHDIPVQTGVEIVDLKKESGNGVSLVDSNGNQEGPYDLVIVADGARSRLRDTTHKDHCNVRPYRWGTLWATVEDNNNTFHNTNQLLQVFKGTSKMMGILPTGYRTPIDKTKPPSTLIGKGDTSTPLVTLFWSLHHNAVDDWKATSLDIWKQHVRDVFPGSEPILSQLSDHSQMSYATYYDVRLKSYHSPTLQHVAYIGDAAHAMSPVLGQGVNLALQESIGRHGNNLDIALKEFTAARKPLLFYYQSASRWLNPWFQSSYIPGFALTRDLFFAPFSTSSDFLKREMLLTLAGAKKGFIPTMDESKLQDYKFWNFK